MKNSNPTKAILCGMALVISTELFTGCSKARESQETSGVSGTDVTLREAKQIENQLQHNAPVDKPFRPQNNVTQTKVSASVPNT
jgi:hypothetical protein